IANHMGQSYFEKMIKKHQLIIKEVRGIENFLSVKGGAIITCNHFNACDNYAVWRAIREYMGKKRLYKVIREGNYTNFPNPIGFFFRHCNTLPLSSNSQTMKNFLSALKTLLQRGEKVLIYPEQAMWWNYKKPRPLKNGAFRFATMFNVPIIPVFITMTDSEYLDDFGFPVQEYTIHFLEPIYPNTNISRQENIEYLKNENYNKWVNTYESFYHKKLEYLK
ncbi:MAG: lysophospholipid acyltransferase family protein, partial [Christensenellales bacterium]